MYFFIVGDIYRGLLLMIILFLYNDHSLLHPYRAYLAIGHFMNHFGRAKSQIALLYISSGESNVPTFDKCMANQFLILISSSAHISFLVLLFVCVYDVCL